ncbi:MAG: hypothetical protein ACREP6_00950, partial [Candidatus Binataceae bacterium]
PQAASKYGSYSRSDAVRAAIDPEALIALPPWANSQMFIHRIQRQNLLESFTDTTHNLIQSKKRRLV